MARELQAQFEHEANEKHLEGQAREDYIGGAWHRVKNHNRTGPWWESKVDQDRLEKVVGHIDEIVYPKGRDSVVIRQGESHYELPVSEYFALVRAGKEMEDDERREARRERRELRAAERDKIHQLRMVRTVERIEYGDVVHIIQRAGGIKAHKTVAGERDKAERGELELLPRSVMARTTTLHKSGKLGLTLDEAATAVAQHMPWLNIDTPNDLVDFFERHADKRARDIYLTKIERGRIHAERLEREELRRHRKEKEAAAAG